MLILAFATAKIPSSVWAGKVYAAHLFLALLAYSFKKTISTTRSTIPYSQNDNIKKIRRFFSVMEFPYLHIRLMKGYQTYTLCSPLVTTTSAATTFTNTTTR